MAAAATIAGFSLPVVMMIKESVNRSYESGLQEGLLFERRTFPLGLRPGRPEGRHEGLRRKAQARLPRLLTLEPVRHPANLRVAPSKALRGLFAFYNTLFYIYFILTKNNCCVAPKKS
jgi:hypothetical protein